MEGYLKKIEPVLEEIKQNTIEAVLTEMFGYLYFQDYNRECDYSKMTGAQVVEAQHKVLKELEKRFNFSFEDAFHDLPF